MRPDLAADYLGLRLSSPVVVGACPLTLDRETVRQSVQAGAGAVVLPSLFEEQIVHHFQQAAVSLESREETAEHLGYRADDDRYNGGPAEYLKTIVALKRSGVALIASLDGYTSGKWLSFARQIEASGADALELNLHTDTSDPATGAEEIEATLRGCVQEICSLLSIPVAVKLSPYFTSLTNLAWRLADAGASGLVIFGQRPMWEVNVDSLRATTRWSLTPAGSIESTIDGLIRARSGGPRISLAASGGISSGSDIVKTVLAGADIAMVTSSVYREGPEAVGRLVHELCGFLQQHQYSSFGDLVHSRLRPQPTTRQRLNYLEPLTESTGYEDPTPQIPPRSGDRWGHVQDE